MTIEFSLLIALGAVAALAPVALQLRGFGDRVAALRHALETAPTTRELRYTIREVQVRREGNVVALPVRTRPALLGTGPVMRWDEAA